MIYFQGGSIPSVFKTPAKRAVMNMIGNADCELKIRNCVKGNYVPFIKLIQKELKI